MPFPPELEPPRSPRVWCREGDDTTIRSLSRRARVGLALSEKESAPSLHMFPVIKWRLWISCWPTTPLVRWLRPIVQGSWSGLGCRRGVQPQQCSLRGSGSVFSTLSGVELVHKLCVRLKIHHLLAGGEPAQVFNEPLVRPVVLDDFPCHTMEDRQVGAGSAGSQTSAILAVEVSLGSHTITLILSGSLSFWRAILRKNDRMALGHVRAHDKKRLGLFDVRVRACRFVRPERGDISAYSGSHAQARIAPSTIFDFESALPEFVECVAFFGHALAGAVVGHCVLSRVSAATL